MSEKKLNKKSKVIICILAILVIVIIAILIFKIISANNSNISSKKVLIEYSYKNLAWSYTYYGTVICEDGSIYSFKYDDREQEYDPNEDLEDRSKNILEHVSSEEGKMKKDDLKQLKEQLKKIENDTTGESGDMYDFGQSAIEYYNYETNEIIVLNSYGDYNTKNNSQNINDVLDLLNKYDIKSTNF